jgi:hypothetical protein
MPRFIKYKSFGEGLEEFAAKMSELYTFEVQHFE